MANTENGARIKAFGGSSSKTSTKGGGRHRLRPEHHVPRLSLRSLHVADYHRPVL